MWFLLQLIDHEVHENNEVVGGGLGLGPGGSGGSHLSHPIFTCGPEPELTSTTSLSLQSWGSGNGAPDGVLRAAQTRHQTLVYPVPLPVLCIQHLPKVP